MASFVIITSICLTLSLNFDGPSPKDVQGSINGLSFNCDERTVMSGDLHVNGINFSSWYIDSC
ncbi:hypothetical protein SAMN05216339_102362 [Nitrosomonas eutropha]|uniref:Uncharacterized protein n=1 Tax=Nitrosomonas eutropha TaxID=916 RepID=A0A1I7GC66_9PROT|nr:hypothetical protein SAMN05216339_102362 [Nitrosomonas eutropha]